MGHAELRSAILVEEPAIREPFGGLHLGVPAILERIGGYNLALSATRELLGGSLEPMSATCDGCGGDTDEESAKPLEEGGLLVVLPAKQLGRPATLLELPANPELVPAPPVGGPRVSVEEPGHAARLAGEHVAPAAFLGQRPRLLDILPAWVEPETPNH